MHVCDDPVDFGLLGFDALPQLGVRCASSFGFRAGLVAVALRLEARGELVLPDCAADEPDEPGERVALFGRSDVDAERRPVLVDELEHLVDCPATIDEPFPGDDAADLTDMTTADPLQVGAPVGQLHRHPTGRAARCPQEPGEPANQLRREILDSGPPAGLGTVQIEHFIQSSSARSAGRVRACAPLQVSLNRRFFVNDGESR